MPGLLTPRSDAGSASDAEALLSAVSVRFGTLDVSVVDAGVTLLQAMRDWDAGEFDELTASDARGPFLQLRALRPQMDEGDAVVLVFSIVARRAGEVVAAYGSSKGAVTLLGTALVETFAERGVRVNAVSPGPIDTPAWAETSLPEDVVAGVRAERAATSLLGRHGTPAEVAEVIANLASPATSYVAGADVSINGGILAARGRISRGGSNKGCAAGQASARAAHRTAAEPVSAAGSSEGLAWGARPSGSELASGSIAAPVARRPPPKRPPAPVGALGLSGPPAGSFPSFETDQGAGECVEAPADARAALEADGQTPVAGCLVGMPVTARLWGPGRSAHSTLRRVPGRVRPSGQDRL